MEINKLVPILHKINKLFPSLLEINRFFFKLPEKNGLFQPINNLFVGLILYKISAASRLHQIFNGPFHNGAMYEVCILSFIVHLLSNISFISHLQ